MDHCFLRRIRREVLGQLPPRTDTAVPVAMTSPQAEEHAALRGPIAALMKMARRRPLTQAQFLRLMQLLTTQRIICNGLAQLRFQEVWPELEAHSGRREELRRSLDSPKLDELREIVEQVAIGQGRRIVVFSQWRRMLRLAHWAVEDLLEGHGLRAAFFTGKESQRRRTRNVVDFHDDPATRLLFASDAGGVGLNLQRAATCCINLELPWNPAVLEQRIGRIYRIGQTQPVDVYNLVAEEGIEARIATLVSDKRAFFEGLFDGASDEVRFEGCGTFLDRLEKIVEPPVVPELQVEEAEGEEGEEGGDGAVEALLLAADESRDREVEPAARPAASDLGGMLRSLRVERTKSGGLSIEAPPESAAALAQVFEVFASLLRTAADDPRRSDRIGSAAPGGAATGGRALGLP